MDYILEKFQNQAIKRKLTEKNREMALDWSTEYARRHQKFLKIIHEHGSVSQAELQELYGYGPGVFERTRREVLQLYPREIHWNKKTKHFTSLRKTQAELI